MSDVPSRSEQAVRWLVKHGGSMDAAGEQFGVTHQAVSEVWGRMYGGKPPLGRQREEIAGQVLALAREGKTRAEIATATGTSAQNVQRICSRAAVHLVTATEVRRTGYDAACAAVAGGACLVDVTVDYRIPRGTLARELRRRGIKARRGQSGRMDGRIARAIERVRRGESVVEACNAERVSSARVYIACKDSLTQRPEETP